MSAIFEAFEKKRVSPSEIKTYSQDLGLWFAKYGPAKLREDAGPGAWRGDAVEAGFNAVLYGRPNAQMTAAQVFETRSMEWTKKNDGEIHPDHDEEAAKVAPCLERAIAALEAEPDLKAAGTPSSAQQWCEVLLPNAPIPLGGKWDWSFGRSGEGFSLDLKTSNTIPSEPEDGAAVEIDPDHGIQFAIYAKARQEKTVRALYVSSKLSGGIREETKEVKGVPEKRWYHKSSRKRLKFDPATPEGQAEVKALDVAADSERRNHVLVTLDETQIEFYANAAVEALLSMEELMKAALALSEYECTTPRSALARLCRPNLLATGGGFYKIWKPDFAREAALAIPEWGLA